MLLGAEFRELLRLGCGTGPLVEAVHRWLGETKSFMGAILRTEGVPLLPRPEHRAAQQLFPLPLLDVRLPARGRARERARRRRVARLWTNAAVAALNAAFCLRSCCDLYCSAEPCAAPSARLHAR